MTREKTTIETKLRSMDDSALIAIFLTSEQRKYFSREYIASKFNFQQRGLNQIISLPPKLLAEQCDISYKEALQFKLAGELIRRCQVAEVLEKPKISNSRDAYLHVKHLEQSLYEEFWIVVLNKANRVIDRIKVSEGGLTGTVVDPRKVYKLALDAYATSLILVHNHPSGNLAPSEADITITTKLVNAGKMLDIAVLDHIIIGCEQFYSFADNGII
jgi:DNA repair protein RadC